MFILGHILSSCFVCRDIEKYYIINIIIKKATFTIAHNQ